MSALTFIIEAQSILAKQHAAYSFGSDRINNYEDFIWRFVKANPDTAKIIAREIIENAEQISEASNMTPQRVLITAKLLMKNN
jgi:hypothetical protein